MDQNIKNRLVGITVIFALAVIFLPMILDGSGVRKDKLEVVIPQQTIVQSSPEFETRVIELSTQAEDAPVLEPRFIDENSPPESARESSENTIVREVSPDPDTRSAPETSARLAPVETKPKLKAGGDSWVLQVGSFQDRDKALAQRDKIRKSKIAAVFIEQFTLNDKPSFRVRLGPFINRDQTRVAQNKIKAKHDIDGIIMKYER